MTVRGEAKHTRAGEPRDPIKNPVIPVRAQNALTYTVTEADVTAHEAALAIAYSQLTGLPTTLAGYGITDAYTETEVDALFSTVNSTLTTHGTRLTALESPIRMRADRSGTAQTLTSGAINQLIFNNEIEDADGAYDNTTGKYTAPAAGDYTVQISVAFNWTTASAVTSYVGIKINDTFYYIQAAPPYGTQEVYGTITAVMSLAANDEVTFFGGIPSGTGPNLVAATYSNLTVARVG